VAEPTAGDIARIARRCGQAHAQGLRTCVVNGVQFNLIETGWCARFVRQCYEAATGHEFPYLACNAREMEQLLVAAGLRVDTPQPGDCICFNRGDASGPHGHTGVHLSTEEFAENTSSTLRGPGTVISRYTAVLRDRISGFYRLLPTAIQGSEIMVCDPDSHQVYARFSLPAGEWQVVRRPDAPLAGDHLRDLGKLFVEPAGKKV